jgi:hypothetical protein
MPMVYIKVTVLEGTAQYLALGGAVAREFEFDGDLS